MPERDQPVSVNAGERHGLEARNLSLRIARALHLLGLAMFLGSILSHISIAFVPGTQDRPEAMLLGRQAIEFATWGITIPGLTLLFLTGLFMSLRGGFGFGQPRWLTVHQIIGILILLAAGLVLVPTGDELLRVASEIVQGSGSTEVFKSLVGRERTFGPVNLALTLLTILIAVLKPTFRLSRH